MQPSVRTEAPVDDRRGRLQHDRVALALGALLFILMGAGALALGYFVLEPLMAGWKLALNLILVGIPFIGLALALVWHLVLITPRDYGL